MDLRVGGAGYFYIQISKICLGLCHYLFYWAYKKTLKKIYTQYSL